MCALPLPAASNQVGADPTPFQPCLYVRLLGGLALAWGDAALPTIASLPVRSLFAYLITYRDRGHTRDLLTGTLWPDLPDAHARRRLSQALWQIGRLLHPLPSPAPYLINRCRHGAVHSSLELSLAAGVP